MQFIIEMLLPQALLTINLNVLMSFFGGHPLDEFDHVATAYDQTHLWSRHSLYPVIFADSKKQRDAAATACPLGLLLNRIAQ